MKFTGLNLLEELAKEELRDLRAVFHKKSFSSGTIIFTPEEPDSQVFVIAHGRVRIYLAYEDKEFSLAILNPGDLYSSHAGCYVQALDDTELLLTDVNSVKEVMDNVPTFTRTMVRVLGHILQNAFSIIGGLAFKDIYTRLMDFMLDEARHSGVQQEDGTLLTLNLTIEQLAQLMGASRQTVSTLLGDMVRAGLVQRQGRGVYLIPDLDALERAASDTP